MKILDLFCGAGGAATGMHRACPDAEIIGVDNKPQPRYPFMFVQGDAMTFPLDGFDFIWASPPCQAYSEVTPLAHRGNHPDLIAAVRVRLLASGRPFCIENVEAARKLLIAPVMLCGSMFKLKVWRHRYFEIHPSILVLTTPCHHDGHPVLVTGTPKRKGVRIKEPTTKEIRDAMECGWMIKEELDEAIPPAYSEYILRQVCTLTIPQSNHKTRRRIKSAVSVSLTDR